MQSQSKTLVKVLTRVVPVGFMLGAAIEVFMINVRIGDVSFYDTALRLEAERRAARAEELEAARARLHESRGK